MAIPLWTGNLGGSPIPAESASISRLDPNAFIKGAEGAKFVPTTGEAIAKGITQGIEKYQQVRSNQNIIEGQDLDLEKQRATQEGDIAATKAKQQADQEKYAEEVRLRQKRDELMQAIQKGGPEAAAQALMSGQFNDVFGADEKLEAATTKVAEPWLTDEYLEFARKKGANDPFNDWARKNQIKINQANGTILDEFRTDGGIGSVLIKNKEYTSPDEFLNPRFEFVPAGKHQTDPLTGRIKVDPNDPNKRFVDESLFDPKAKVQRLDMIDTHTQKIIGTDLSLDIEKKRNKAMVARQYTNAANNGGAVNALELVQNGQNRRAKYGGLPKGGPQDPGDTRTRIQQPGAAAPSSPQQPEAAPSPARDEEGQRLLAQGPQGEPMSAAAVPAATAPAAGLPPAKKPALEGKPLTEYKKDIQKVPVTSPGGKPIVTPTVTTLHAEGMGFSPEVTQRYAPQLQDVLQYDVGPIRQDIRVSEWEDARGFNTSPTRKEQSAFDKQFKDADYAIKRDTLIRTMAGEEFDLDPKQFYKYSKDPRIGTSPKLKAEQERSFSRYYGKEDTIPARANAVSFGIAKYVVTPLIEQYQNITTDEPVVRTGRDLYILDNYPRLMQKYSEQVKLAKEEIRKQQEEKLQIGQTAAGIARTLSRYK